MAAHTNVLEPEMINIPGGYFKMGSPVNEHGRSNSENPHNVLVKDFSIGKNEVTLGEYRYFVSRTNYQADANKKADDDCHHWDNTGFRQSEQHPVVCVSFRDAMAYVNWLSKETGRKYSLPTEAQWEYAARASSSTSRHWGDQPNNACSYANVADLTAKNDISGWNESLEIHSCNDRHSYTAPVGSYKPNEWGLNDMMGNVSEWTCSLSGWWGDTYTYEGWERKCGSSDNSKPRMVRGSSWKGAPNRVRSASRAWHPVMIRKNDLGFRLSKIQ
jgi:formylglycine-generating enzyme required for sulfatase activity